MKAFNGIIGVLSIFGALYCIFWSDTSFLNYGWIVTLILTLLGICAIVTYIIDRKEARQKNVKIASTGVIGLIFGIAIFVVSILARHSAAIQGLLLLITYAVFVVYMLFIGIIYIIVAAQQKKTDKASGWGYTLLIGLLLLITGAGGLILAFGFNALNGINIGLMLAIFGCAMIGSIFSHDDVNRYDNL